MRKVEALSLTSCVDWSAKSSIWLTAKLVQTQNAESPRTQGASSTSRPDYIVACPGSQRSDSQNTKPSKTQRHEPSGLVVAERHLLSRKGRCGIPGWASSRTAKDTFWCGFLGFFVDGIGFPFGTPLKATKGFWGTLKQNTPTFTSCPTWYLTSIRFRRLMRASKCPPTDAMWEGWPI